MGLYTERLSKRIHQRKANNGKGYCVLCGNFGNLTLDHVPPKCTGNTGKVEQKTLTEFLYENEIKPLRGRNGQTFKTLCPDCNNNLLGGFDNEISKAYHECLNYLEEFTRNRYPLQKIPIHCNVKTLCRGIIGHLVAAQPEDKCNKKPPDSGMLKHLRDFVLFGNDDILENYSLFFWFYPHQNTVTANLIGKREWFQTEKSSVFCILKFFPFGFAVVSKGGEKFFHPQHRISTRDQLIYFDLSTAKKIHPYYPLSLGDNDYCLVADELCYASKPSD